MAWQFNHKTPVFSQIADRLMLEILNGTYSPGEQIPTVRQLAFEAAVNPNTVQRALAHLEETGLLYSKGTVGRFVTEELDVLERARARMLRETVRRWLEEASTLGLTAEELIQYIKEEEENK